MLLSPTKATEAPLSPPGFEPPWLPWMRELSSAKEHSLQYPAYRTGVGKGRETRLEASPWWRGNFLRMLNAGREWRDPAILELQAHHDELTAVKSKFFGALHAQTKIAIGIVFNHGDGEMVCDGRHLGSLKRFGS